MSALESSPPAWAEPYSPLLPGGDIQTIVARYWPIQWDEVRFPTTARYFRTEPDVQVLAHQNSIGAEKTLLILHGLTACSSARYMLTLARRGLESGFNTIRLNVRNCGGTEHLCPTLYHSGLTTDLRHVIEQLPEQPLYIVGFSMGGNIALKLAGEWGDEAPAHVRAVCAISAPIRLDLCSRRIGQRRNWVYEQRFLRMLRATLSRKRGLMPERFRDVSADGVRSIWEFDDIVTAPAFGFDSAADYYARSSAAAYLDRIRIPALLIEAVDDPFIPWSAYEDPVFGANQDLRLLATDAGGHVAFLDRRTDRRFWAEEQALRFFATLDE